MQMFVVCIEVDVFGKLGVKLLALCDAQNGHCRGVYLTLILYYYNLCHTDPKAAVHFKLN